MLLPIEELLSGLDTILGARGMTMVCESRRALQRGLYLASSSLLAAASEAAWFNLARAVPSPIEALAKKPVSWTEHAVAEFGERPQAILNEQIVDEADLAIALFYDRLGTPTGEAESGTAEEIKVLVEAGKPVAVLTNTAPRAPLPCASG